DDSPGVSHAAPDPDLQGDGLLPGEQGGGRCLRGGGRGREPTADGRSPPHSDGGGAESQPASQRVERLNVRSSVRAIRIVPDEVVDDSDRAHPYELESAMAFADFTLESAIERFELTLPPRADLFAHVRALEIPPVLEEVLDRWAPQALEVNTDKARSE